MYGYMGVPVINNMSGLSRAMHVLVLGRQVYCVIHVRIVMSWGQLCLPTFTRV